MINISENQGKNGKNAKKRLSNECKQYRDSRYISAIEAAYRLFEFNLHGRYPSVCPLTVHLPNKQFVTFDTRHTVEQLKNNIKRSKKTTLTQWFANNRKEKENPLSDIERGFDQDGNVLPAGPDLLYSEYPRYYAWSNNQWKRRTKLSVWQIGRMHTAHPSQGQRWFLRILLNHVKGATSFVHLLEYQDIVYNCFKKRCAAQDLLEDDKEWDKALKEASEMNSSPQMRRLFAILLKEVHPTQPLLLWKKYRKYMIDDMIHKFCKMQRKKSVLIQKHIRKSMYSSALFEICSILEDYGINPSRYDLEKPLKEDCWKLPSRELVNAVSFNATECKIDFERRYKQMNSDQKKIFDQIISAVYPAANRGFSNLASALNIKQNKKIFFIDSPGGTVCYFLFFFFFCCNFFKKCFYVYVKIG